MDRALVAIQSRREFQPVGGKLGVYFGGVLKGVEGQLEFNTYEPAIQAHVVLGTNVDIEWDEAPGKEYQGKPTVKRTVRQLYIGGKPLVEKQSKSFNNGFGRREDNPETRASIEAQTAVNDIVSMINAGKVAIDNPLSLKALAWLHMKLDAVLGKPITAAKPADAAPVAQKAPIQAPRDLFAGDGEKPVMANKAQLYNLRKYVKTKDDAELLLMAEGRVGRDLASLDELTIDEADKWLNEVAKKK
jgi:hypothetical protein